MKYHEKLNLKSPIFKYNNTTTSRTPSKSPIKPAINPTDLFQKVCCPNCKYGFKIIRQQVMKENPPERVITPNKKNKIRLYKEIQTQTEGILTQSNNNSPTKSIVSQHKFSKTYDFSGVNQSKEYEFSQLNSVLQQQQNIENRQLRDSQFKFKPLSLSPHSKFSKSKNLLKTLDSKAFQPQQPQQMSKSPAKTVEFVNPYYVPRDQSPGRKEENLYKQTLPFRDEDQQYSNERGNRQYGNGGNIQREPMGYGNNSGRGESGLVSPHASSEKLEENHVKQGVDRIDPVETPKGGYKKPHQMMQRSPHNLQPKIIEPEKKLTPTHHKNYRQQSSQAQPVSYPAPPPQMIPSKRDAPQFDQLITEIVLKNQEQSQVIKELQEICRVVSQEVELPSYCKMLAFVQQ